MKRRKIPESVDGVVIEVKLVGVLGKKWQIIADGRKVYTSRKATNRQEAIQEACANLGVPTYVRRKLASLNAS